MGMISFGIRLGLAGGLHQTSHDPQNCILTSGEYYAAPWKVALKAPNFGFRRQFLGFEIPEKVMQPLRLRVTIKYLALAYNG